MKRSSFSRLGCVALAGCAGATLSTPDSSLPVSPPPRAARLETETGTAVADSVERDSPESDPPGPVACLARFYDAVARHDAAGWSIVPAGGDPIAYTDIVPIYELRYPTGPIHPVTEVDFDPGRVRIDSLFLATYGRSPREVEAALVRVTLAHKTVLVHRRIAEPLRRVASRIDAALLKEPAIQRFFDSPGGTFNWRVIRGTRELSMHSWAIAIDLDTSRAHYWMNDPKITWKNRYPEAIVDAFEAEGFIWGGRWYHYDTMHFEYRPELLDPHCYPDDAS